MNSSICITGMHRSGTSLTASWLQKCGLRLDDGNLMGAGKGNSKGHFEDLDFVNLHIESMLRNNKSSKGWIVTGPENFKFSAKELRKATMLVESRSLKYDFWGWKDPRTVMFLKEWKKVVPDLKFIFVWRDAHAVINSLRSRSNKSNYGTDKISVLDSYKCWKVYNQEILEFLKTHAEDCIVLNIADLIDRDKVIFEKINSKFEVDLTYYAINNLLEEKLMSEYDPSWLDQLRAKLVKVSSVQKELYRINL